jgi:hypothetical protein
MRQLIVPVLLGLYFTSAVAHHSPAIFDRDREIVLEGIVSSYNWTYPHVYIFVDVEDDSGQLIRWQIEGDDPRTMSRAGWRATTLAIGDQVLLRGNPQRNTERRHALMVTLTTPDGATLTPELLDTPEPTVVAPDIFSIWEPTRFDEDYFNGGSPTEKGAAAQAGYTEEDNPESQCIPPAPPLTFGVGLTRVSRQGENVLIRTEEFEIERIVYMDGREIPANGERTLHGYSVGRWEGDVLVIDTALFSDNIDGSLFGIPSGAQKRLVERMQLTEDGTQLSVAFVLEDPEYLQGPATGEFLLDHVPNETFMPAACDPESARRWMGE